MMMKILNKPILSLSLSTTFEQQFPFHFSMTVDGTIKAFSLHSFVGSNLCFLCGAARDRLMVGERPW